MTSGVEVEVILFTELGSLIFFISRRIWKCPLVGITLARKANPFFPSAMKTNQNAIIAFDSHYPAILLLLSNLDPYDALHPIQLYLCHLPPMSI